MNDSNRDTSKMFTLRNLKKKRNKWNNYLNVKEK